MRIVACDCLRELVEVTLIDRQAAAGDFLESDSVETVKEVNSLIALIVAYSIEK